MLRILKISAALAVLGAIAGAIGGCLALALTSLLTPRGLFFDFWLIGGAAAALGGGCGVLVAPVLSWTLLRDVPIWRCATETALVTSFAGIAALILMGPMPEILAIAGLAAVLAVARLKWAFRRRRVSEPDVAA